jgi:hypothetical protein
MRSGFSNQNAVDNSSLSPKKASRLRIGSTPAQVNTAGIADRAAVQIVPGGCHELKLELEVCFLGQNLI